MLPALRRFLSGGPQAPAGSARGGGRGTAAPGKGGRPSFEDEVLFTVFSSNLVGIVCARSIHYQFYSWWVPRAMGLGTPGSGRTVLHVACCMWHVAGHALHLKAHCRGSRLHPPPPMQVLAHAAVPAAAQPAAACAVARLVGGHRGAPGLLLLIWRGHRPTLAAWWLPAAGRGLGSWDSTVQHSPCLSHPRRLPLLPLSPQTCSWCTTCTRPAPGPLRCCTPCTLWCCLRRPPTVAAPTARRQR